jgi:hypothetical protein
MPSSGIRNRNLLHQSGGELRLLDGTDIGTGLIAITIEQHFTPGCFRTESSRLNQTSIWNINYITQLMQVGQ